MGLTLNPTHLRPEFQVVEPFGGVNQKVPTANITFDMLTTEAQALVLSSIHAEFVSWGHKDGRIQIHPPRKR